VAARSSISASPQAPLWGGARRSPPSRRQRDGLYFSPFDRTCIEHAYSNQTGMTIELIYKWRATLIDENDTPRDDFCGWDGNVCIGRIRLEPHGPKKGHWQWSGQGPRVRQRLTPHQGYEPTAREAARMIEDYYHKQMAYNGVKGSKQ
jgi:hypothetical protein